MKILVRLPNWLGDMVMAAGFLEGLTRAYPHASIDVIVKKGFQDLLPFFPGIRQHYLFSKKEHKGLAGAWRFGRSIRRSAQYDLFFSLPDSISTAVAGFATGAEKRIGFRKEGRSLLLTHAYNKPKGIHRSAEYFNLLEQFTGLSLQPIQVALEHHFPRRRGIVVNINSEAQSRRLTTFKATEILSLLRTQYDGSIELVAAPREVAFVENVLKQLPEGHGMYTKPGGTSLPELAAILAGAEVVLSTDSGPAHLANALGTPVVVLFGAGDENNTAPFNAANREVIRLGGLSCEPCLKNVCVRYEKPQCLERLNTLFIVQAIKQKLEHAGS